MEITIKSEHDLIMEEFEREGRVKHFTAEENQEILKSFNTGLVEFELDQRIKFAASMAESKHILIF